MKIHWRNVDFPRGKIHKGRIILPGYPRQPEATMELLETQVYWKTTYLNQVFY